MLESNRSDSLWQAKLHDHTQLVRIAELGWATTAQAGTTFVQQGIVVIGIFFVADYHLTLSQMGVVVSLVSVGWMLAALFTGLLMDIFGPRIVQFCGSLLTSICALLISYTHNLLIICLLLLILGLGVSVTSLAGTITVLAAWPREQRGLPLGIRQMGVPLGSMLAAFILPSLASRFGLHLTFRLFAVLLFVVGVGFSLILPRVSLREAFRSLRTRANFAPRVLLYELRQIALPCLAGFLLAFGQYTVLSITIPMLHTQSALSVAQAGSVLAVAQIGGAIARISLGLITDRSGGRLDLTLFYPSIGAVMLALLVALAPAHQSIAFFIIIWLLIGMTMVGWNALLLQWTSERVRQQNSGAAVGLTTSSILLGAVIAPPFMGQLIQSTSSFSSAWLALALLLLLASGIIWCGFHRPTMTMQEENTP